MMGGTQSLPRPEPTFLVAFPLSWTIHGPVDVHADPEHRLTCLVPDTTVLHWLHDHACSGTARR